MAEAGKDTVIRPAEAGDAETILRLVCELAAFEGLSEHARARVADLRRDGFGERPLFECLIVERAGAAVGFALFYFTYSTFEGRPGLYVEDLYLAEDARGGGLGRRLLSRLAAIALDRGCSRIDLAVLDWNPASAFYGKLGFRQVEAWLPYRLDGAALRSLADLQ